jgi:peptidoglycan hydrolase-like protein with peptidoglycan-binding domain
MRLGQLALLSSIALTLAIPAAATTRTHRGSTAAHKTSAKHAKATKAIGQRAIDDERATQIQEALIKAGYLSGQPSGHWDAASEAAMQKVQADNGWQTKLVPDSRALIKLGLGPSTASVSSLSSPGGALTTAPSSPLAQQ